MNKGFLAHFWVDLHDPQCILSSDSIDFRIYRSTIEKSWIFSQRPCWKFVRMPIKKPVAPISLHGVGADAFSSHRG
jgi:hypothetical protein